MAKSPHALHRQVRRRAGHTGLTQRKSGIYHVRIFRSGKEVTRTTGCSDEDEAALVAARIRRDLEVGGNGRSTVQPPPLKVEVTIEEVIKMAREGKNTAGAKVKSKTITTYASKLRRIARMLNPKKVIDLEHALPHLWEILPPGIHPGSLEQDLRSARSLFSPGRLKYYRKRGWAIENPFKDFHIRPNHPKPVTVISVKDAEELKRKAKDLEVSNPVVYRAFLLLFNAGLRAQEVTHLKWEDIDENGIITIRPDRFSIWTPKNDIERDVPLHPQTHETILTMRLPDEQDEDYVIPLKRKRTQTFRKQETRAQSIMEASSDWLQINSRYLAKKKNPNHALRKYYISRVANTLGIFVAQKYAGHRSVKTTERYYAALQAKPTVEI